MRVHSYELQDALKHQKESLERFLQKDVPVEKRRYCGIHKELIRAFGLKDHYNIYLEEIPSSEIVQYLARRAGSSSLDVIASIKAGLPVLSLLDEEKLREITSYLEKHNVPYKEEPSGLVVTDSKYKAIVQYCDYRVEMPEETDILACSAREKALKRRLVDTSLYLEPITGNPKYTNKTLSARLYVKFRTLIYKDDKRVNSFEEEMFFTDIPVPTNNFSFIINGVERFVISVRQRPVGILFFENEDDPLEPYECYIESAGVYNHRIIRIRNEKKGLHLLFSETNRIPIIDFFKALGVTDEYLRKHFLNTETGSVKDLRDRGEDVILTRGAGEFGPWKVLTKNELSSLPDGEIEYIRFANNPVMFNTLYNNEVLDEDTSLVKTYKVLEKTSLVPTKRKTLYSRIYSWLNSLDFDYIGRKVANDKLKPIFEELGEMPSYDYLNLTLLDVIAATKYFLYLRERRSLKDGSKPEPDDPFSLKLTRALTLCELLENALREGLVSCVRSTREKISRELFHLS